MTNIAVCIPSIGMSGDMLPALIDVCTAEPLVDTVEVWDNSDTGLTIYQEFNQFAQAWNADHHLAFLNDDIVLQPGSLAKMADALRGNYGLISGTDKKNGSGVRRAHGTIRRGGIRSWAFIVRQGCWPVAGIDERFQIWFGDDDLLWQMDQEGHWAGVHEGVYVEHRHSLTSSQLPWVPAAREADTALWKSLGRP